jgi:molybdopterin synthase catalytic subunit
MHDIGAHSIFLGQVRADEHESRKVTHIDYSCYREMAEEVFHAIREEAFAQFDLTCLHIYHSLGRVNAGEICLFVFTSSKHRRQAIDACNFLVEEIKKRAPVWGKEMYGEEEFQWKGANLT